MRTVTHRGGLPYPPAEVFAMVEDVERYPEFLPGWRYVHILGRRKGSLLVDQEIRAGLLKLQFRTEAQLSPPDSIRITGRNRWIDFALHWQFQPAGNGCYVMLRLEYEFRSRLWSALAAAALSELPEKTIAAFSRRAVELHKLG